MRRGGLTRLHQWFHIHFLFELENYGYGHLVKPILELGGPYVVGEAIGYN